MNSSSSYQNFKEYLKTTSYFDLIKDHNGRINLNIEPDIIDVTHRYEEQVRSTIKRQEIAIIDDDDFWIFAAKQGYIFYKYSCITKDLEGFLAFVILIEQWLLIKNNTDLFSSSCDHKVVRKMLLMTIAGTQEMNANEVLIPQDTICIVLVCLIALEMIEVRLLDLTQNPIVSNIKQLIIKIIKASPAVFDLFFASNSNLMRDVIPKNSAT